MIIIFLYYRLRMMLVQLENIFGEDFWKNVVLEFTHYHFDENSIDRRADSNEKSPTGRKTALNKELRRLFEFQVCYIFSQ